MPPDAQNALSGRIGLFMGIFTFLPQKMPLKSNFCGFFAVFLIFSGI